MQEGSSTRKRECLTRKMIFSAGFWIDTSSMAFCILKTIPSLICKYKELWQDSSSVQKKKISISIVFEFARLLLQNTVRMQWKRNRKLVDDPLENINYRQMVGLNLNDKKNNRQFGHNQNVLVVLNFCWQLYFDKMTCPPYYRANYSTFRISCDFIITCL